MIRAVVVSLFLAVPAAAVADDKPLTPEEAGKQVGKVVTVEMKVVSWAISPAEDGIAVILDSQTAIEKAGHFQIRLAPAVAGTAKIEKVEEAEAKGKSFKGKTVQAKGKVAAIVGSDSGWYISVTDPANFKVVEKK